MEKAVEDGGGDGGVVVEDLRPMLEGLVGGDDQRAAFVAMADDLEEQIRTDFIKGQIAEFVADDQVRGQVFLELELEPVVGLCGEQVVDDVDCSGEQD